MPTSHYMILASETISGFVAINSPTDEIGDSNRQAAYAVYVQEFRLTMDYCAYWWSSGSSRNSIPNAKMVLITRHVSTCFLHIEERMRYRHDIRIMHFSSLAFMLHGRHHVRVLKPSEHGIP